MRVDCKQLQLSPQGLTLGWHLALLGGGVPIDTKVGELADTGVAHNLVHAHRQVVGIALTLVRPIALVHTYQHSLLKYLFNYI